MNPKHPQFRHYGGRGIKICDRWLESFAAFADDMGSRPNGCSVDRIDNDGPYSPENCRWATRSQQSRNQRQTRRVMIGGVEYLAADLAVRSGLKTDTIAARAKAGLSYREVVAPEPRTYPIAKHSGDKAGVAERTRRSRSRTKCRHGHPWPEFLKINKAGFAECVQCGRDKALRCKRKRLGRG